MTAGVSKELAALGRSLMREAYQHNWDEHLCTEAGWNDRGEKMIQLARQTPQKAEKRWRQMFDETQKTWTNSSFTSRDDVAW